MHISTEQMLACKPSGSLETKAQAIGIYNYDVGSLFKKKKNEKKNERLHTSKRQEGHTMRHHS